MKNYLSFLLVFVLIIGCKRECQDERADNYKEGHRKDGCDFSRADNWDKDIIVDSIKINGNKVELYNVNHSFRAAEQEEEGYYWNASNKYFADLDTTLFLDDTLKSFSIFFAIPVASNFETNIYTENFSLAFYNDTAKNNLNLEFYSKKAEVFSFLEEKEINGVKYFTYSVEVVNINKEIFIDYENFIFSDIVISISARYDDIFNLPYKVVLRELTK